LLGLLTWGPPPCRGQTALAHRLVSADERAREGALVQAPALGPLLEDLDTDVKVQAGLALEEIGEAGAPVLSKALESRVTDVPWEAVDHLGMAGTGPQVRGALDEASRHKDPEVRARATGYFLQKWAGDPDAREVLRRALSDPEDRVWEAAVSAMKGLRPGYFFPAVGFLAEGLRDPKLAARAEEALRLIGNKEALSALASKDQASPP